MRFIPAQNTTTRPWVIEVLKDGAKHRDEVFELANVIAAKKGYVIPNMYVVKKTLASLRDEGLVFNLQKGWWALSSDPTVTALQPSIGYDEDTSSPPPAKLGKKSIRVLRQIGKGTECVYVMQYVDDVDAAQAKGDSVWPCKVGKSKNFAARLLDANMTFQHQEPEVALVVKCEDCGKLERAFHDSLHLAGKSVRGEWFQTNAIQLEAFYRTWSKLTTSFE